MTSKLTREQLIEKLKHRISVAEKYPDVEEAQLDTAIFKVALAAMDSEPVVFTDERNLHHIAMGRETSLIWGEQSSEVGDVPLYRHAQPAPVVLDERAEFNAWNNDENLPIAGVGAKNAAWLAWQARAAMVNSPVIPEGYVLVPRDPTDEMIAAAMDCNDVLFNSDETFCVQFGNIYAAMIAAATQEVKP